MEFNPFRILIADVPDYVVNALSFGEESHLAVVAPNSFLLGVDALVDSHLARLSESLMTSCALVSFDLLMFGFNMHCESILSCIGAHASSFEAEISFLLIFTNGMPCNSNHSTLIKNIYFTYLGLLFPPGHFEV